MSCPGLHCPGCPDCGGAGFALPAIVALIIVIIVVAILDAAKSAISATAVVMTDIMDGVLIFALSVGGAIVVALLVWIASHAGRFLWKYRGNYGLRQRSVPPPIPVSPGASRIMLNGETVYTAEVIEAEVAETGPLAIEPPHENAYDWLNRVIVGDKEEEKAGVTE